PDSVEICFVPDGDHGALIRRRRPELSTAGPIVDTRGNVLTRHEGIENFTIGQRKGLKYAAGQRRYGLKVVPEKHQVVVGEREELLATGLMASGVNWLTDESAADGLACTAKIRYRHPAAPAKVYRLPGDGARVEFTEAQSAITPGQAVVF